jgi:hypothetical protein
VIVLPLLLVYFIYELRVEYFTDRYVQVDVNAKTSRGNSYQFDLESTARENGYPIHIYVCDSEMREAWNSRATIRYDSLDRRQQLVRNTLLRFLTSKGLRKDADAVEALSDEEVRSVENGIANVYYQDLSSIKSRMMQVVWEYDQFASGDNPSGHSVMQRLEFWKAAVGIIEHNPLFGVGTGDMPKSYRKQYREMHSKLDPKYYLRAHNQYLAIGVGFGLIGLAYFLFALFYPLVALKKWKDHLYVIFFITALLSMLTEDTLETQAGSTFFAFFNAFFLFSKPSEEVKKT